MHTIRLRAAWRSDGAEHTRRFNKPTGLGQGERVWLAVASPAKVAEASLNGLPLDFGATGRCEITESLRASNELVVCADDTALLETVRLEIEPSQES